ncbi:hypothetical protein BDA96_08G118500 [Sorghum bicolor]|uniref:Uncharacterized protein n=1 Tax=Sorghum bicolor TaxID=4558 RepID=A0A921U7Z4_SORBI|nr:hypothetical protein BDA96_08G118500 [Sorghum bicolor]KAG0520945.1 hypothetical protein BDA96_08G118500 [Sorghum bicolor]
MVMSTWLVGGCDSGVLIKWVLSILLHKFLIQLQISATIFTFHYFKEQCSHTNCMKMKYPFL